MAVSMFPRMHVSLYVSDIQKSVEFYSKFFAVEPVKIRLGYAKYILSEPSLIISFIQNPAMVAAQCGHFGFQVENNDVLNLKLQEVKSLGLKVREEMGTHCCFAVQDKFWVSDPDGFQWEIYVFKEDAEFNDPHYSTDAASACCSTSNTKPKYKLRSLEQGCQSESECC